MNNRRAEWAWLALIIVLASLPALTSTARSQVKDDWRTLSEVPVPATTDGRLLYFRYCADCHGADARGTGPMPTVLSEEVPDLTLLAQSNGGVFPRARVEKLQRRYAQACSPSGAEVDPDLGRAYAGLGMILESVDHRVLAQSADTSAIPVQMTAIEVGPGPCGREIVSFDISEYGDPLHTRHIRLPFSAYLKPRQFERSRADPAIRRLLPIFEIPLSSMSLREAIAVARDPDATLGLAQQVRLLIPDCSRSMEALLDKYETSELAAFHNDSIASPGSRTRRGLFSGSCGGRSALCQHAR